jgi:hypothetical protein
MVVITLVVIFLKLTVQRTNKALVIAREIKSAIFLFSYIPFTVHFVHNLISVGISKNYSAYNIVFIIIGLFIVAVFMNHFLRMA